MKSINKSTHIISTSILLFTILTTNVIEANEIINTPLLIIPESEFDFKEVREGTLLEHSFTVLNKGNAPVEIKRVKTD
ncbi:MAG: hypothetical protein SWO11_11185 [Thermodesulfobacteriota bacterium]|nr:hypothetical protein [Thermodesulfobacteriota bacterium]